MKAFIIDRIESPRLRAADVPDPVMPADDVLVQIHAAGVNPVDFKIKSGEFKHLCLTPPTHLGQRRRWRGGLGGTASAAVQGR